MWQELVRRDREVVAFLLDHHPTRTRHIESNAIVGCGWDHHDGQDTVRWFGEGYSPSGTDSSLVDYDLEVGLVLLSNRIARTAIHLEKGTGIDVWAFAQPHIITTSDSGKLFRYMGNYHKSLPYFAN